MYIYSDSSDLHELWSLFLVRLYIINLFLVSQKENM